MSKTWLIVKEKAKKNITDVFVKKQLCGRGSLVSAEASRQSIEKRYFYLFV